MTKIEIQQVTKATKDGVTIIYMPEQHKWGVQLQGKKPTFHTTFDKVIKYLTTEHDKTISQVA